MSDPRSNIINKLNKSGWNITNEYTSDGYRKCVPYGSLTSDDVIKNNKKVKTVNKASNALTPIEYQKKAEESITVKLFNEVYERLKKGGK